jgi:hypothetical protein
MDIFNNVNNILKDNFEENISFNLKSLKIIS